MVLLQTWSFSLILLFFAHGILSDDTAVTTPSPPIDCSNLIKREYTVTELKSCNDETILAGIKEVEIDLKYATQEMVDNLFQNKEILRNIKIWCPFGCKITEFIMEKLTSTENLSVYLHESDVKSVIISSPQSVLNFMSLDLFNNWNLSVLQIENIAKADYFQLSRNPILENVSMIFVNKTSVYDIFNEIDFYGNHKLPLSFVQLFEENRKSSWNLQPPHECEGHHIAIGLTPLEECKYIHGRISLNEKNNNIGSLNLTDFKIKSIREGYIEIRNTEIESIGFLVGTSIGYYKDINKIENNQFLCDYMDVVDNYPKGNSELVIKGNCKKCQIPAPQENFDILSKCENVVVGNLNFARKVTSPYPSFKLQWIDGCLSIENTDLQSIDFLKETKTRKECKNKIANNPHLCYFLEILENNPRLLSTTSYSDNCHACNTFNNPLTNFQLLSRCERVIFGNVKLNENVAPMPRWINLERIDGCFEIINTKLTTVKFLVGTRTRSDCVNVIKGNKYICDVTEVLNNIPEGTYIEAQNNCEKICYDASEVWDKDCEVLHTISDVPISYVKQSKTLKRVHGPIKITSLKTETVDPSVLPQIEYDELVFRGNEFLCDEEAVRKLIPKGKKVSFKQNCWKRCPYPQILYGRKCTVFTGILDHRLFDNIELFERVLLKLEGVEGQIKIFGSYAQHLNFRKLKYVKNDKLPGPAILIENNKILKTVFLENLETVTSKTEPRIRIKHNGDFKFEAKDWQRIRNQTKTRLHKSLVVDIHRTKTKAPEKCSKDDDSSFKVVTPQKGILYWGALTLLTFLCIVIIIIFGLFCWFCYKVESGNY